MTIYKYPLPLTHHVTLDLPQGATVRHVGEQAGQVFLWAEVDPDRPVQSRPFRIVATGMPVEGLDKMWHRGTVQMGNGLVWHVYEANDQ